MEPTAFIERCREPAFVDSAEAAALLADPFFRDKLLRVMGRNLEAAHRLLLLNVLAREARRRLEPVTHPGAGDLFENIYYAALLLYRIGDVRDSLAIWKAKMTDMDTGCGMEGDFMVGAGREETIAYLRSLADPQAATAAEHLALGSDYESVDAWHAWRSEYFSYMTE